MPFGLAENKNIVRVRDLYIDGFQRLLLHKKPENSSEDEKFTHLLEGILQDFVPIVQTMAVGVLERKREMVFSKAVNEALDLYLNRFFMARIGIRFLIEHHIASKETREGVSGIIHSDCDPISIARSAADDSILLCERQFGISPEIKIFSMHPITFTYVPGHLRYILSELLKNALRATIYHHGVEDNLPPIDVVIAEGRSDITIKISDKGGGMPFEKVDNVWTYVYTSSSPDTFPSRGGTRFIDANLDTVSSNTSALSGYGCGLPLSRLYAQYFGGGLDLKSMEGYGTDAYCYLNRLGRNCENLPVGVSMSPAERDSSFHQDASLYSLPKR